MEWIKHHKLIVAGVFLLLVTLLVSSRRDRERSSYDFESAFKPPAAVNANSEDKTDRPQLKKRLETPVAPEPVEEEPQQGRDESREEAPADSSEIEEPEAAFDSEKAMGLALAEVRGFNEELANELRTINPNARKTRLKASQLREKAGELDEWIKSQDGKADMTLEERLTWQAQRQVWMDHANSLRNVAQRLSATRGTKRKVRILAKEISDSFEN